VTRPELVRLRGRPELGPVLPAWGVAVPILALAFGLGVVSYGGETGLVVGILLAVVVPFVPARLGPWVAIAVVGLGQFSRPAGLSWQFFLLLAGVHLLHVLGSLAVQLRWRAWIQVGVFRRLLLRFVVVQVPVQLVGGIVVWLLEPNSHGHRPVSWPGFAALGALGLLALAAALIVPVRRGAAGTD
jgi:hypothetical protein